MEKQNEITKIYNSSIYGKIAREEANKNIKHMTVNECIEEMKPERTKCNICGYLITNKKYMYPCGPFHSEKTGLYVCPNCYDEHVKPLIDGLEEMKRTIDREELMRELNYRY